MVCSHSTLISIFIPETTIMRNKNYIDLLDQEISILLDCYTISLALEMMNGVDGITIIVH